MKHHGSKFEYEEERNHDLMSVYHKLVSDSDLISLPQIYREVVNMPSARFWVSEERAAIVISAMAKGDELLSMRPTKREMFVEIYNRAMQIKKEFPSLSVYDIAFKVVRQPAPKFYITPGYAKNIIFYAKKKWYEARKQKLRLSKSR